LKSLTKKQKQALDYIRHFIDQHGHAPSYTEVASGLGLSSESTIHVHVTNLVEKGYLTKKWNSNRSIDLSEKAYLGTEAVLVPLAGRIAAGLPIEAVQDQETIAVPPDMIGRNETYVLQVKGDSMIEDHVLDGDHVIVERRSEARDGEMVVALIGGTEATLKRLRRVGDKIRLEPANPVYQAIVLPEHDVKIQGVVIGILRKYKR
jgi:repressor LexA